MPRPKSLEGVEHLHIRLRPAEVVRLRLYLHSDVEGKAPVGALRDFVSARLREFFSGEQVPLGGGHVMSGTPEAAARLRAILAEHTLNEPDLEED